MNELNERLIITDGATMFVNEVSKNKAILGMILFVTISRSVESATVVFTAVDEVVQRAEQVTRENIVKFLGVKTATPLLEDHETIKEALELDEDLDLVCLYEGYEYRDNVYCLRVVKK